MHLQAMGPVEGRSFRHLHKIEDRNCPINQLNFLSLAFACMYARTHARTHARTCTQSLIKHHTGFDLGKGEQDMDAASKLSDAWIKKNTMPCPKCSLAVTKNDGCNHMTCTCSHQFCWVCRRDWSECGGTYNCAKIKKTNTEANTEQEALLQKAKDERAVRFRRGLL